MGEAGKKIKAYFDYNVFDYIAKNGGCKISDKVDIFCSVAHVEEYYKAFCNCADELQKNYCKKTREVIENFSREGILNRCEYLGRPISLRKEKFNECLKRVCNYDTRDEIEKRAICRMEIDKIFYDNLCVIDDKVVYNSTLSYEDIWKRLEIVCCLSYLNMIFCGRWNKLGIRKADFTLDMKYFKKCLWHFVELETVIELLNDFVLEPCGYNKDGKKKKNNSGRIHDVSHMIYASYCDVFVTKDKLLKKRAEAIYYFLGIRTQVILYEEFCKKTENKH